MTVSIWITAGIAIAALFFGFGIGRSVSRMTAETEAQLAETQNCSVTGKNGRAARSRSVGRNNVGRQPAEWVIFSPVSGEVTYFYENNKCRVSIIPEQEQLYAPVSGRVKKLYPMGNAMLISADLGVELVMSVAKGADELCNGYFRPRVVQNEVISKGKLLLAFDRAGLEKEEADVTVDIIVEQVWKDKSIVVTQCGRVKTGDALLWV